MVGQERCLRKGTKIHIIDGYIYQPMGEIKLAKNRLIIKKVLQRFALEELLEYKELQKDKVLLNYVF